MTTFFEKMKDLLVRDPYPTAGCPIAGVGPTTVTLRIDGHSGTAGYQPHGRVEVSYYDRNLNQVTEQTYPIGGGYQPSLIQIETGSTNPNERWIGQVNVNPVDNRDFAVPFWKGSRGINGVFAVPGYNIFVNGQAEPCEPVPRDNGDQEPVPIGRVNPNSPAPRPTDIQTSRDIVAGRLFDTFTGEIVYADAIIRGVAAAEKKREREIAEAAAWQREHNRDRQDRGSSSGSSSSSNNIATSSASTTNSTGYIQGGGNYSTSTYGTGNATRGRPEDRRTINGHPIVIDLDDDGVEISPLGGSTARFDYDNDGFKELTAWVGKDDGLLVYDIGNDGLITETREVVIAEWTADTTDTDLDALKAVFDTNNDGILNANDTAWANSKIWNDTDQDGTVCSNRRVRAITPPTPNVPIAALIRANPLDRPLILPRYI